jgi:hypothetical protein
VHVLVYHVYDVRMSDMVMRPLILDRPAGAKTAAFIGSVAELLDLTVTAKGYRRALYASKDGAACCTTSCCCSTWG